jgi:hypothetical protein
MFESAAKLIVILLPGPHQLEGRAGSVDGERVVVTQHRRCATGAIEVRSLIRINESCSICGSHAIQALRVLR